MRKLKKFICLLCFASLMQHGFANDSMSRLGVGGLVLMKTDSIRMDAEVLEISTAKIRVEYKFRNITSKDITTIVAFPMPLMQWKHQDDNERGRLPMKAFTTWVDGYLVKTKTETKAFLNGKNITPRLYKLGETDDAITSLLFCDSEQVEEKSCASKKLMRAIPELMSASGFPQFKIQQTAWWKQRFNANSVTRIVHEYEPLVGGQQIGNSEGISLNTNDDAGKADSACIKRNNVAVQVDEMFRVATGDGDGAWGGQSEVEYILGTGRNWQGRTIKDFTLRIKKDEPSQVVSLCFPTSPIQVNPLTLEYKQKNFVPQDKLVVYFFSVQ